MPMSITKTILYRQLHGSISEVYKDLPGSDIPASLNEAIPKAAVDILAYRERNTPRNHSFLRIRAGAKDLALRAMCAQKHGSIAQTCYAQKYLLELTPELLLNHFDELLQIDFYSEDGFNLAASNAHGTPRDYRWSGCDPIAIDPDALKAVLYGMVNRWRRGTNPVVIAVPDGADYDRYTCSAVSAIYAYLPAALRLLAGFMTYADPATQSNGVTLFFLPAGRNYPGAVYLDGSGSSSVTKNLLNSNLPAELKAMLSDLTAMSESERRQALTDIATYVESAGDALTDLSKLHWSNYTNYWSLRGLGNLDPDEAADFESLKKFAASAGSVPEAQKAELSRIIKEQVKPAHLDQHFLNKAKTASGVSAFYKQILPYLPLCAMARTTGPDGSAESKLEDHVWAAFWSFCADQAAAQADMAGLDQLHDTIADTLRARIKADGGDPDKTAIEMDQCYLTAHAARKAEFLKDELAGLEEKLHQDIRSKCTILGKNPDAVYKELAASFLATLPAGLSASDECVLQVLQRAKTTLQEARATYQSSLLNWFDKDLDPDLDTITSEICENLRRTIRRKQESDIFTSAPADIQEEIKRHCRKKNELFSRSLLNSGGHYKEIRSEIQKNIQNYFKCLDILAREQQAQTLSQEDCSSLYDDFVAAGRPLSIDAYSKTFRQYYDTPMSVAGVAPFESTLGGLIARDIQELCKPGQPHHIPVRGKTLSQLAEQVQAVQILQNYLTGAGTNVSLNLDTTKLTFDINTLKHTLDGFLGRRPCSLKCGEQEFNNLLALLIASQAITDDNFPNVLAYLNEIAGQYPAGHWVQECRKNMLQKYLTVTAYNCTAAELKDFLSSPSGKQNLTNRSPEQLYQLAAESYHALSRVGLADDRTELHLQYVEPDSGHAAQPKLCELRLPLKKLMNTLYLYLHRDGSVSDLLSDDHQDKLLPLMLNGAEMTDFPVLTAAILNMHELCRSMGPSKIRFDLHAFKCIGFFFLDHRPDEESRLDMYRTIRKYGGDSERFFFGLPKNARNPNTADRIRGYISEYRTFCSVFTPADRQNTSSVPFAEGAGVNTFRSKIMGLFRKSPVQEPDAAHTAAPDPATPKNRNLLWVIIPVLVAALLLTGLLVWHLHPGFHDPITPTAASTEATTVPDITTEPETSTTGPTEAEDPSAVPEETGETTESEASTESEAPAESETAAEDTIPAETTPDGAVAT